MGARQLCGCFFLCTTLAEGQPQTALESMACGLPVVSTRVGGIPDYTHPSFAELLSVGDVEGIIDSIFNLLKNPDKLKEKSILARKYAEDKFAWDIIANNTIDIYKKIVT